MKKLSIIGIVTLVAVIAGYILLHRNSGASGITYKYSPVETGDVERSIQATGTLVAYKAIDIKSKAGGVINKIAVDEGSIVKTGDLIAIIDPRDTQAAYDQAASDFAATEIREQQARETAGLQVTQSSNAIRDAATAVKVAELKLQTAEIQAKRQPALSSANVATAQAAYEEGVQQLSRIVNVTNPQNQRDVLGQVAQTKASLDTATATYNRDLMLLKKGYIAQQQADQDHSALIQAREAYNLAKTKQKTLPQDLKTAIDAQKATVARLQAALVQAKAQMSDTTISQQSLVEAQKAVTSAKLAYDLAVANQVNNSIRKQDVDASQDAKVRDKVAMDNAKVQLDSTVVTAPRDGVITTKYLEEGTIIPPGASLYSQGTSIVQLSDVHIMYCDCLVAEADISNIKVGQSARVTTESYKNDPVMGKVIRVSPAAATTNNVTTVKVRIQIDPDPNRKILLRPGMNASCDFIVASKANVLKVPSQAVQHDAQGSFVMVQGTDPLKPVRKDVTVGVSGNDSVEIISGLSAGDQVVTATIDLDKAKEIQKKLEDAKAGGLAGG